MEFKSISLKQEWQINRIFTIHYFDYMSDFFFLGEAHDFWELVCVDKGRVMIRAEEKEYVLRAGDIIFHKPNEFHNVKADGKNAPSLFVLSFACTSSTMKFFENKVLQATSVEKALLANIIREAKQTYTNRLEDPYFEELIRCEQMPFGAEHLIKIYLEQLLIELYRRYHNQQEARQWEEVLYEDKQSYTYVQLDNYLLQNIQYPLTIDKICEDNLMSRSKLEKLIKTRYHCGIIEYYIKLRIEVAKQLIREGKLNFSQIADQTGYNSIHYFSRQFKKVVGMSPTEYITSIRGLADKPPINFPLEKTKSKKTIL